MHQSRTNNWHRYGGQGIGYDPRWEDYRQFMADMAYSYFPHAELHRKDGNGNYDRDNCVWLSKSEHRRLHWSPIQARRRRV
ncbi:MAG: hypothetical protein JO189_06630 [Deltaproteobacteria bacterium]|nr:hypothetical protein [Deltaproteobacteria bacterium]